MKEQKDFLCNVKPGDFVEIPGRPWRKVERVTVGTSRVIVVFTRGGSMSAPSDERVTVFREVPA